MTIRNAAVAAPCIPSSNTPTVEAVTVADIEDEIAHIEENGARVKAFPGMTDEGRCRELCAMYLREFILHLRATQKLAQITSSATTSSYLPGLKIAEELLRKNGFEKSALAVGVQIRHLGAKPELDRPSRALELLREYLMNVTGRILP